MLRPTLTPIRVVSYAVLAALAITLFTVPSAYNAFRARIVDSASLPLKVSRTVLVTVRKAIPFASYRDQIKRLKETVAGLESEVAKYREYRSENQRLRRLLDFKQEYPVVLIPAHVIARDPANWAHALIIDKGEKDGIRAPGAALTPFGLAGRVVEAGNISAKVLLITDPNSKVGVMIQKNREGGLLIGRADGTCKMIYLSLEADVSVGDQVITAGYGADIPKGVIVGTVTRIEKEPGRLYQNAIVKPSQNLSKIEELACVR